MCSGCEESGLLNCVFSRLCPLWLISTPVTSRTGLLVFWLLSDALPDRLDDVALLARSVDASYAYEGYAAYRAGEL